MAVVESSTIPGVSTTVEFWCEGVGKDSGDLHFSTLVKKKKNLNKTIQKRVRSGLSLRPACVYMHILQAPPAISHAVSLSQQLWEAESTKRHK